MPAEPMPWHRFGVAAESHRLDTVWIERSSAVADPDGQPIRFLEAIDVETCLLARIVGKAHDIGHRFLDHRLPVVELGRAVAVRSGRCPNKTPRDPDMRHVVGQGEADTIPSPGAV